MKLFGIISFAIIAMLTGLSIKGIASKNAVLVNRPILCGQYKKEACKG